MVAARPAPRPAPHFFIPELSDELGAVISGIAIGAEMIVVKFHKHRRLDLELDGQLATMQAIPVRQVALLFSDFDTEDAP
jgi:hypothetical protein